MEQMFVWAIIQREFISRRSRLPERHWRTAEHPAPAGIFRTMRDWLQR
jgi:hypothetical protein